MAPHPDDADHDQPRGSRDLAQQVGHAGHPTSGTILRSGETLSYEGIGGTATAVLIMDYLQGP